MKVLCDCGGFECEPTQDKNGDLAFEFPIASITMMGLTRYELRAIWFVCPECNKSYMVLPYTSPIENNNKAVFITEEEK